MKNLGITIKDYASKKNGHLPSESNWCDTLIEVYPYSYNMMRNESVENDKAISDYAFNANLSELKLAELPEDIVFLFETKPAKNPAGGAELIHAENHLFKGCFVLFGDMHIEFVRAGDINDLRWEP
jgi:hypothetical protein